MEEHATAGIATTLLEWIEIAALSIELLAVAIIVIATLAGTAVFVRRLLDRSPGLDAYEKYKRQLGRALLLGLEILVAADIVRTVALEPSLTNVGVLAILVIIRTFLSWSLVVEMERRWPWQRGESEPAPGPTAES
jgi:uncharacterized membrane protein